MNITKLFRKRSASEPSKSKYLANNASQSNFFVSPIKDLLVLVECEPERVEATMEKFKAYFGEENILKASNDGLIYYVGVYQRMREVFVKKMVSDDEFTCKTFTLGFIAPNEQKIGRYKALAETTAQSEILVRRHVAENLDFFMNDNIPAPEPRFSVDANTEVAPGRRPSVLDLFKVANGEEGEEGQEAQKQELQKEPAGGDSTEKIAGIEKGMSKTGLNRANSSDKLDRKPTSSQESTEKDKGKEKEKEKDKGKKEGLLKKRRSVPLLQKN